MGGSFLTNEASALMQRGIDLLGTDTPEGLTESVACFDAALSLRRLLFTPGDHGAAYLLAASWMNRGDALSRLGGETRLMEAVRSYDEALAVLRDAPPDADPLYRRRHAIAWMNRGLTLQAQGTGESAAAAAVESLARAVAVLSDWPEHALLLAGILINHAKALLHVHPPRAAEARAATVHALEKVAEIEDQSPLAAEIHLKAQILLCRAAETSMVGIPDPAGSRELLCAATDAVETGLSLARRWEERGDTCLGPLPTILFHFGIDLYRRRQPRYLCEFIRENLQTSVSPEWHRLAEEALSAESHAARKEGFAFLGSAPVLEIIQTLRFVQEHARELRPPPAPEII